MDPIPCEPTIIPPPPPLPPPPPPPPPPIPHPLQRPGSGSGSGLRRFRSVFWERIPQERVEGKNSVWSESDKLFIDLSCLDELFEQPQVKSLEVKGHCNRDKRASKITSQHNTLEKVCILGERRSLKVGIFMHHIKSNLGEIISDIREGRGQSYSTETLNELYKLLPDSDEAQRLRLFKGEHSQLEDADLFMLRLVLIPSYRLRLDTMILQKDFHTTVTSLSASACCLATAAAELRRCAELHSVLRLVLKAGNYMNSGGCVGEAAGFRISSLLKLADTKANRPGMTLLHYVAMEAMKKDPSILSLQNKLKHVGPAARLSVDLVQQDFSHLQMRIGTLLEGTDTKLHTHITPFLQYAKPKLAELQKEVECMLEAQRSLQEFLCEDEDDFRLEEVCTIFTQFMHCFIRAAQENELCEQEERCRLEYERVKKAEKRHSVVSCSTLEELNKTQDALETILQTPMDPPRRRSLHSTCRTLPGGIVLRKPPITLQSFVKTEASKTEAGSLISVATPPTESDGKLSPSSKPTSSKISTHFPTLPCLHVGETHALVPGLLSYSSLAPPTRTGHTNRERKQKEQQVTECKQEVTKVRQNVIKKEVESVCSTKPHRGKLSAGMTKSTNQTLPRPSRLPLLRTSSMQLLPRPPVQSECVKLCSIRENKQYKRPHPLTQMLARARRVRQEEQEVRMEEGKMMQKQEVVKSRSRLPVRLASPVALS